MTDIDAAARTIHEDDPKTIFRNDLLIWSRITQKKDGTFAGFVLFPGTADVETWENEVRSRGPLSSPSSSEAPSFDSTDRSLVFERRAGDRLTSKVDVPSSGYTLSMVGQAAGSTTGVTSSAITVDPTNPSRLVLGEEGGSWVCRNAAGAIPGPLAIVISQVTIVSIDAGTSFYVQGALIGSNDAAALPGPIAFSVPPGIMPALAGWDGKIREVVVVNRPATPPELASLSAYYQRVHLDLPR